MTSTQTNQIARQFADNLPSFQQAIIQHLHNWGLDVTTDEDGGMAYALTITPLPSGQGCEPIKNRLIARLAE